MPKAIDTKKLEPGRDQVQVLDIANPPTIDIPYQEFPKCIYLHPKDKSKEHRSKVVHSHAELEAHLKQGWRKNPHIPEAPVEAVDDLSDFDTTPAPKK